VTWDEQIAFMQKQDSMIDDLRAEVARLQRPRATEVAERLMRERNAARDQRDTLAEACRAFLGQLDYLRNLWGDEGVTRTIADKTRHALSTLDANEGNER
jgi:hypothetical protein